MRIRFRHCGETKTVEVSHIRQWAELELEPPLGSLLVNEPEVAYIIRQLLALSRLLEAHYPEDITIDEPGSVSGKVHPVTVVRHGFGMTQEDFAAALDVGPERIREIETGREVLKLDLAKRIQDRFGVHFEHLMADWSKSKEIERRSNER